jgi:hypothetical protein
LAGGAGAGASGEALPQHGWRLDTLDAGTDLASENSIDVCERTIRRRGDGADRLPSHLVPSGRSKILFSWRSASGGDSLVPWPRVTARAHSLPMQRGSAMGDPQIGDAGALPPRNGRRLAEEKTAGRTQYVVDSARFRFRNEPHHGRRLVPCTGTPRGVGRSQAGAGGAAAARLEWGQSE